MVDIDPNWYPGQPETENEPGQMPSVLSKLQKWGDYASFGEPVHPSRFIPMKTPLSTDIVRSWSLAEPPRHKLTVSEMLTHQSSHGRKVGLIIDLSNHECLYTQDLQRASLAYEHIKLVAKELPPLEYVGQVAAVAKAFWADHPHEYIAIHCAYGFNRTGFIVTSFLIQEYGLTVDEALAAFATARPPGVKHEKFKHELWRRYPAPIAAPQPADASVDTASDNSSLSPTFTTADAQLDDPDSFLSGRPLPCDGGREGCCCAGGGAPLAAPQPTCAAASNADSASTTAPAATTAATARTASAATAATTSGACATASAATAAAPAAAAAAGSAAPAAPSQPERLRTLQLPESVPCQTAAAAGSTGPGGTSGVAHDARGVSDCASRCASGASTSSTSTSTSVPIPLRGGKPPRGTAATGAAASRAGTSLGASPPADNESLGFSERTALASLSRLAGADDDAGGSSDASCGAAGKASGGHRRLQDIQWGAPSEP